MEIQQVEQKIHTKQVLIFVSLVFYVVLHLNLKRLRFTGEPVTQRTRQSHVNVNHVIM